MCDVLALFMRRSRPTRDQVTTVYTVQHSSFKFCIAEQCGQSNIPVLRLLLLNMKCHYYNKGLHFVIKLTS